MPWRQKYQNIKQKWHCNKFSKDFKNGLHPKKKKKKLLKSKIKQKRNTLSDEQSAIAWGLGVNEKLGSPYTNICSSWKAWHIPYSREQTSQPTRFFPSTPDFSLFPEMPNCLKAADECLSDLWLSYPGLWKLHCVWLWSCDFCCLFSH